MTPNPSGHTLSPGPQIQEDSFSPAGSAASPNLFGQTCPLEKTALWGGGKGAQHRP